MYAHAACVLHMINSCTLRNVGHHLAAADADGAEVEPRAVGASCARAFFESRDAALM